MNKVNRNTNLRKKIKSKVNSWGTEVRPRLTIYKSNKNVYVQAINDDAGKTVASASSIAKDAKMTEKVNKTVLSEKVGKKLAENLKKLNIKSAVFDRGSYKYHGRVKALADAVRAEGIQL